MRQPLRAAQVGVVLQLTEQQHAIEEPAFYRQKAAGRSGRGDPTDKEYRTIFPKFLTLLGMSC